MGKVLVIVIVLFLLVEIATGIVVDLFWSIFHRESIRGEKANTQHLHMVLSSISAAIWISMACEVTAIPVIGYLDRRQSRPEILAIVMLALLALNGVVLKRVSEKRRAINGEQL